MREYDLHLAAASISPQTVRALLDLGFERDAFANNTRCKASEFHGTYRGTRLLPDDLLWNETCALLLSDSMFAGGLEEEYVESENIRFFDGNGEGTVSLSQMEIIEVPAGEHKACDIHIAVNLDKSSPEALGVIEGLEVASFERQAEDGLRRIYSITCQTQEDGSFLFERLANLLVQIPKLYGRIKLESTSRWLRYPEDAASLPITSSQAVKKWIS